MPLNSYIEKMLTLTNPDSDEPSALVEQVGVQYLYPIVPPNTTAFFITTLPGTQLARGFPQIYAILLYRIRLGKIPPGVFNLSFITGTGAVFSGTVNGEADIDYLFFLTPNRSVVAYVTNLTNANQRFEMFSEYLIVPTYEQWKWLKASLIKMNFPNELPDYENYKRD